MFKEQILTQLQSTSKKSESSEKRLANIQWVIDLPREGFSYRNKTKQVRIVKTSSNEDIFIQYPGKETSRSDDKRRPWDFFPRIRIDDHYIPDLDFRDIWEILFEGLQNLTKNNEEWLAVIATLFYRMAFMNDHLRTPGSVTTYVRELSYKENLEEFIIHDRPEEVTPLFRYSPNTDILKDVSTIVPSWGGMSFEAFLHYNDLLAWNEDCKYFYRMQQAEKNTWIRETGRINTLLTHLSIIGYVSGKIRFSDVCMKFARGKGVAPATREEILRVCDGYVTK